jgi:CRISPR-associated protein Csm5
MACFNLQLEVLSPLHIGNREGELKPIEFFTENGSLFLISESRLAENLATAHLIEDFYNYVSQDSYPSLNRYFHALGVSSSRPVRQNAVSRRIAIVEGDSRINAVRLNVADPLTNTPYIPGSSIKGAIRNALLQELCEQDPAALRSITAKLPSARRNQDKYFGSSLDNLLRLPRLENVKRPGPNTDWMRGIKVSDAFPNNKDGSSIYCVRVVSLTDDGFHFGARNASINAELIKPGSLLTCQLQIDDFTFEVLSRSNNGRKPFDPQNLVDILNKKASRLCDADSAFFQNAKLKGMVDRQQELMNAGANLKIGWGSGLLATTVDSLLSDEDRRAVRGAFYPHRNNPMFPQSRKVTMKEGKISDTLGWVKVTQGD